MMKIPYGKDGDLSIADTDSRAFPDAIVSRTAEKIGLQPSLFLSRMLSQKQPM